MTKAKNFMTINPTCCHPEESAEVAVWRMRRRDCGALPVVDPQDWPIGMVTDRDIVLAAQETGKPLRELKIIDVMSPSATVCHIDDEIKEVESDMCRYQVRRIPVVNNDHQVVGIISLCDLVRRGASARTGGQRSDRDVVSAILAAVVEPREKVRTAS